MTQVFVLQTLTTIAILHQAFSPSASSVTASPPPPEAQEVLAVETSAVQKPEFIDYTTKSGDTLASIAKSQYGNEAFWISLWNDNSSLGDPAVLHAGTALRIRTKKPAEIEEPTRPLPTATPTPTPTEAPTPTPTTPPPPAVGATGSFEAVYKAAGERFGIPWEILSAIHMVETGRRDGPISSGAGPQGPMQFMPGTWAVYGTDGNGDGTADINSAADAIHGAANYLSKHGSIEEGLDSYGRIKEDALNIARALGWTQ